MKTLFSGIALNAVFALVAVCDELEVMTEALSAQSVYPLASPERSDLQEGIARVVFVYGRGYRGLATASDKWLDAAFTQQLLLESDGVIFVWPDEGTAMLYSEQLRWIEPDFLPSYLDYEKGSLRFINNSGPWGCEYRVVCEEAWKEYCLSIASVSIWPEICREMFG